MGFNSGFKALSEQGFCVLQFNVFRLWFVDLLVNVECETSLQVLVGGVHRIL